MGDVQEGELKPGQSSKKHEGKGKKKKKKLSGWGEAARQEVRCWAVECALTFSFNASSFFSLSFG